MLQIYTTYSFWFVPLCILFSAGISFLLYYKSKLNSEVPIFLKYGLFAFRFLTIFIITFLLLKPFFKSSIKIIKKPVILFAQDNSRSVSLSKDSVFIKSEYIKSVQNLIDNLKVDYDIHSFDFSETISDSLSFSFDKEGTDIGFVLKQIEEKYDQDNVAGLIISSDGIITKGINPTYTDVHYNFPVYAITLGDTTKLKDIYISNVVYNELSFIEDSFPIRMEIVANDMMSSIVKATLYQDDSLIHEKNFTINSKTYFSNLDFMVKVNKPGIKKIKCKIEPNIQDANLSNNSRQIHIEVLDKKQNILLLYNAPHPDIGALKNIISLNKNYKLDIAKANDFTDSLSKYNLVILHQLPSVSNSISRITRDINANKVPVLFIVSSQTSLQRFNSIQKSLNIRSVKTNMQESKALLNSSFKTFKINDNDKDMLEAFPPLIAVFGTYKMLTQVNVFAYQSIKGISTGNPLICFSNNNNHKLGYILGEGVWRWKLFEYQKNHNSNSFNQLINSWIQYLSLQIKKEKFRINYSKTYTTGQSIKIFSELYNDNFELINDPEVTLNINSKAGKAFEYTFSKTNNFYQLNLGNYPEDTYNFEVQTKYNGKIYVKTGSFIVLKTDVEALTLEANHKLLYKLTRKFNGFVVTKNEIDKLKQPFQNQQTKASSITLEKSLKSLIDNKIILLILLLLLSLEWFIRKYYGSF